MERDKEDEADEHEHEDTTQYTIDVMSEEEAVEEEAEPELIDSWPSFLENIENFSMTKKCDPAIVKLNERRARVALRTRETIKNAPKTLKDRVHAEKDRIEKQLESSDKRLCELLAFGEELVTNIRVATDQREYDRRCNEVIQRESLLADLKGESIESNAKFDDIVARWTELEAFNEPMSLWDQIQEQKAAIAEIMKSKDEMIQRCQSEIDRLNEQFQFDRMRQAADLCCLVERVDNQVELLKEAYKKHINLLENTIEDERQIFALNATEKWHSYFDAMNNNFNEKTSIIKARENFYMEQTQRITEQQEELTKMTRIRLEKDCEQLELELRKTRDAVLMNSEKLDYNYQVLQKRNEENVIVNNQQKRRVARLHEVVMDLRKKIRNNAMKTNITVNKLSDDIHKLHLTITEMETKSHSIRLSNKNKFDRIWDINYNEIMQHIQRINDIDRLLHDQQLVMPWQPTEINTYNINNDYKDIEQLKRKPKPKKFKDLEQLPPETMRLLRNMLRKLCDRGGFLVEKRLLDILEPFKERDRCLIRLDNIFLALRIRSLRDIADLTEVFLPYTYCPNCGNGRPRETCAEVYIREAKSTKPQKNLSLIFPPHSVLEGIQNNEATNMSLLVDVAPSSEPSECPNHYLVMEPTLVLHAIVHFSHRHKRKVYNPYEAPPQRMLNYITMDENTIRNYWRSFRAIMPENKLQMWKKLEHGLNHYLDVLKMRQQYDSECMFLRRQNLELRHLLQKFQV